MRALLLIDFQRGFEAPSWGARNNPQAETNAAALLAHWRTHGAPVIHVCHLSTTPGSPLAPGPGRDFLPQAAPGDGEPVFEKSVNSAFIGTGLPGWLARQGIAALTVCGLTTPHCVSTTVRMAANLGFGVTLAHDACAAFAANADTGWRETTGDDPPALPLPDPEAIHRAAIDQLHGEFCSVRATAQMIAAAP